MTVLLTNMVPSRLRFIPTMTQTITIVQTARSRRAPKTVETLMMMTLCAWIGAVIPREGESKTAVDETNDRWTGVVVCTAIEELGATESEKIEKSYCFSVYFNYRTGAFFSALHYRHTLSVKRMLCCSPQYTYCTLKALLIRIYKRIFSCGENTTC